MVQQLRERGRHLGVARMRPVPIAFVEPGAQLSGCHRRAGQHRVVRAVHCRPQCGHSGMIGLRISNRGPVRLPVQRLHIDPQSTGHRSGERWRGWHHALLELGDQARAHSSAGGESLLTQSGERALPGEPVADGSSRRGLFFHESRISGQSRRLFTTHTATSLRMATNCGSLAIPADSSGGRQRSPQCGGSD